jgi:uncharacterized membrane protein YhhN
MIRQIKLEQALKTLIGIYALFCVVYFVCLGFQLDSWRILAKALPVICLTIWAGKYSSVRFSQLIRAGLAMSVGGDILLELHDIKPLELRFLGGLGCFLIAHVCYSLFFCLSLSASVKSSTEKSAPKHRFRAKIAIIGTQISSIPKGILFAIIAYSGVFLAWLSPLLGELLLPVTLYIVAISIMLILACAFYFKRSKAADLAQNQESNQQQKDESTHVSAGGWALFAALSFVVSDSLLALNLFVLDVGSFSHVVAHYAVMMTYWIAQLGFALMVFQSAKEA